MPKCRHKSTESAEQLSPQSNRTRSSSCHRCRQKEGQVLQVGPTGLTSLRYSHRQFTRHWSFYQESELVVAGVYCFASCVANLIRKSTLDSLKPMFDPLSCALKVELHSQDLSAAPRLLRMMQ